MKTERTITAARTAEQVRDFPNAELTRSFEPLRVVFALSALVLGLLASLHP